MVAFCNLFIVVSTFWMQTMTTSVTSSLVMIFLYLIAVFADVFMSLFLFLRKRAVDMLANILRSLFIWELLCTFFCAPVSYYPTTLIHTISDHLCDSVLVCVVFIVCAIFVCTMAVDAHVAFVDVVDVCMCV